ncbi:MAG: hypothetical protein Q4G42_06045 [Neisseria sp.]|nr:hypothetical protein [Neisseria sp.]
MKRLMAMLMLSLMLAAPAWAGRVLPQDMDMAVIKSAQYPEIVLTPEGFSWLKFLTLGWLDKAQSFQMTAAVKVRNQKNLFVTHGNLPRFAGEAVAVRRNNSNQITEIWVLTEPEKEIFRQRALQREQLQRQYGQ